MTSGKQAQRRVDRILDSSRRLSAGLRKPAWAALALLATPVICVLAGVEPVAANKLRASPTRVAATPIPSLASHPLLATMQAPPAGPPPPAAPAGPPPPAPAPQAAPGPPPSPAPAPKAPTPPPRASTLSVGGLTYTLDLSEDWAVTSGEALSASGSFHDSDLKHLKALRRASNGDIIWFRRDSKSYVIRDAATVQQAKAILAPQDAVFEKMMKDLERQQDALSAQQEELSKQMEQLRVAVPDYAVELQKLQAQLDRLHKQGATQEELSDVQGALGDLQGKIGDIQGKAGEQQGALGAKQGELGERQGKLGEQQGKLGEQQSRLAQEASKKMKALLDNALAKGLAQPE